MRIEHPQPDLLFRRFAPLRLVADQLRSSTVPADAFFDPDDFMVMSWCRDDRPAGISLFKHVHTRRYLNLDSEAHAYRYVPPDTDDPAGKGTYLPLASMRDAVDHLRLWELPWMRPELAEHRQGLAWDDRWDEYEALNGVDLHRAS